MVKAHNLYKKTTISKKNHKNQKIRPFEIFWFFKNHKKPKPWKTIFSTPEVQTTETQRRGRSEIFVCTPVNPTCDIPGYYCISCK